MLRCELFRCRSEVLRICHPPDVDDKLRSILICLIKSPSNNHAYTTSNTNAQYSTPTIPTHPHQSPTTWPSGGHCNKSLRAKTFLSIHPSGHFRGCVLHCIGEQGTIRSFPPWVISLLPLTSPAAIFPSCIARCYGNGAAT